jgi:ribonucleoside-diphosphate reductase alpha chain
VVGFEPAKISVAMTKAYLAVGGSQGAASARIRELVAELTEQRGDALVRRQPQGGTFHIEDIQDQVELALMRAEPARRGALLRAVPRGARARAARREKAARDARGATPALHVVEGGARKAADLAALDALLASACAGLEPAAAPAGDPREHAARPVRRRADG